MSSVLCLEQPSVPVPAASIPLEINQQRGIVFCSGKTVTPYAKVTRWFYIHITSTSSQHAHVPRLLQKVVFSENVGHERPSPSPHQHAAEHGDGRQRGGHSGRQPDLGDLPVFVALKVRPVPDSEKKKKTQQQQQQQQQQQNQRSTSLVEKSGLLSHPPPLSRIRFGLCLRSTTAVVQKSINGRITSGVIIEGHFNNKSTCMVNSLKRKKRKRGGNRAKMGGGGGGN